MESQRDFASPVSVCVEYWLHMAGEEKFGYRRKLFGSLLVSSSSPSVPALFPRLTAQLLRSGGRRLTQGVPSVSCSVEIKHQSWCPPRLADRSIGLARISIV